MANIQSKKTFDLNKEKLELLHRKSGNKTILKPEKDKKVYRKIFKKAIVLAKNKLDKFQEKNCTIIQKVIAETIIDIFELPIEALAGKKFCKKIWNINLEKSYLK